MTTLRARIHFNHKSLFDIFHPVVGDMTGEIVGPFEAAVFSGEPGIGGSPQGGKHIYVYMAVPGEDFLGGAFAPAQVDESVAIGPIETALFGWVPPTPDGADHIRFPVGDVCQGVLHRPGVFGLRAGEGKLPGSFAEVCNELVQ